MDIVSPKTQFLKALDYIYRSLAQQELGEIGHDFVAW